MTERTQRTVLNSQTREFVIRLRNYFDREAQNGGPILPITSVVERVADALNIGQRTVRRITKKKYGETGTEENKLHTPKKRKRAKPVVGIDSFDADAIRRHVYGYYLQKEYPTRKKLVHSLKEAGLFFGGESSLTKILKTIGFRYKKCNKRKILMERFDIAMARYTFLRQVKEIKNWQNVVFLDETWLNANHTVGRSWNDDTAASTSKVPVGKGSRLIICHAGTINGFVEGSLMAFASKTTGDYHEDMNGEKFTEWFTSMLCSLPEPSIIIMDNAPYHSMQIDKPPAQSQKKADIVAWLRKNGVDANMNMLKAELVRLLKENKPTKIRYVIDEIALEHGHRVIRLPPYHCEYNAIELVWAQIKGYAARHNTEPPFTTKKMLKLLEEACEHVTKGDWEKVVNRTVKLIREDYERDVKIDNIIENEHIIINVCDDSSDDSENSSMDESD